MKILYVSTISGTINAFLVPHIEMLLNSGHQVDIACNISSPMSKTLLDRGCRVFKMEFQRSPFKKDNIKAYSALKKLVIDEKYDLVHTHTPVASAITRLVCKNIKGTKVFYTAHGFHFYKGASLKNWLIYYPLEKWLSKYTDTLITINKEDYKRAKSKFKAKRVEYIPGVGLDIDKFTNVVVDKADKRQELGLSEDGFVILSVGELNKNKNHEVVIRAIAKINNPTIHYVICGKGPLELYLNRLASELGVGKNVHLLGFRPDVREICKIADVFAFPSLREGLPVSLMEAMAAGLPIVCSNIRGNSDLTEDGKGGYLVSSSDVDEFAKSIKELRIDSSLRRHFGGVNLEKIENYSLENVLKDIEEIYFK
ncbi:glycosyltransferase involved in cell wall biosynthesis [Desulfitispora alkaliphila]|uniref:glycosyltransferase family 4 protein n=1 Tax=Desulfitispora alkaliphila TaxID=622674 RepID=UPI003D1F9BB3